MPLHPLKRPDMTLVKWLLIALAVLVLTAVIAGQIGLLRGKAPTDLGVRNGMLKAPSTTPNSVSSQAALHPAHPMRERADIAPLPLRGDGPATLARIEAIVTTMAGATVVTREPDYLYAQFETRWMKFVDDTEFWFDAKAGVVQVRSASRLGGKDFEVNRQRVEAIRARLVNAP